MDEQQLINLAARLMLREDEDAEGPDPVGKRDPRVQVFLDRVLLRFFGSPSVVVYLRDAATHPDGTIELVFSELPERIIPKVAELVGVQGGEAFAFHNPNTQYPCTGYRFKPSEEDLEGIVL